MTIIVFELVRYAHQFKTRSCHCETIPPQAEGEAISRLHPLTNGTKYNHTVGGLRAMKRNYPLRALLIAVVLLLIPLSACSLVNRNSSYDYNAIEKVQKEVPFTIVIPTYFPKDIKPYPTVISGPGEGAFSDKSIAIGLTYEEKGTNNFIWIMEENHTSIAVPSRPSSVYLDIEGTKVLEEEAELPYWPNPSNSSDSDLLRGILYDWNRSGVNFQVRIFGYDREECRKVIESMIK